MREILFRGKNKYGKWYYGYYTEGYYLDGTPVSWIEVVDRKKKDTECPTVIPETVGQYTGLTDKNGKKIFEGDIVRYNTFDDFDCHSVVKFGEYEQDGSAGEYNPMDCIGWYVEVDNFTCPDWAENDPSYFNDYLKQQNLLEVSVECEIIGNIHDNPELLEGE